MPQEALGLVRAVDLFAKQFPDNPSYVNPNILVKGGTLLLGGHAKIGKSLVMMEIARSVTTAKPLFDNPDYTVPAKVRCLYIEAENGPRSVKERGLKIFKDEDVRDFEDRFWILSEKNPPQIDNQQGLKYYKGMIDQVRPNVLIVDPISFFYSGEENKAEDVNKVYYALNYFKTLYPEDELCVVMAHHFGKKPYGKYAEGFDPLSEYNFRGSSKWKDGADTLMTMDRFTEMEYEWESWRLKMRVLCRHGSAPPETIYNVNEFDDLRVRHSELVKKKLRKIKVLTPLPQKELSLEKSDIVLS